MSRNCVYLLTRSVFNDNCVGTVYFIHVEIVYINSVLFVSSVYEAALLNPGVD